MHRWKEVREKRHPAFTDLIYVVIRYIGLNEKVFSKFSNPLLLLINIAYQAASPNAIALKAVFA